MIPELLVLCTAAGRDKTEQSWADSLSPLYYYSMFLNHTQKMFWYVKVTSEKQLWLENSQQWARIHSQSVISSVISTISVVLRGLAMHGCALLSSPALPFCEKCYLPGALGPSGGKSELNPMVFHSCLVWGASLHVTVCNLHLVWCARSWLQRIGLVFDGECQARSLLCWIQVLRSKCPIWVQESKMYFWPWSFALPMKRQYD